MTAPLTDAEIAEALRGFALAQADGNTPAVMAFAFWCNKNKIAPRAVAEVVVLRAENERLTAKVREQRDALAADDCLEPEFYTEGDGTTEWRECWACATCRARAEKASEEGT